PPPRARRLPTGDKIPGGAYPAQGEKRMRIGLFLGCIASEWFAETHRATIRVLQANGCEVVVPTAQTCCGALHRHAGILDESDALFARSRDAFKDQEIDVIVVNAAGCGAALKEPPHSAPDGLGIPVRDICELLDEIGIVPPPGRVEKKVVYDQPCHLLHGQGVGASAVEGLLAQIPGVELLPLPNSDRCCGSGGVYNLVHPDLAEPIRDEKATEIRRVGPDVVVTGNPGCAMQIASGLEGSGIEVMHPIDLLDRSYQASNPSV
ncbi:MAG: (Fe-S)-binding protein, partial [Planctomycetota bacterium]